MWVLQEPIDDANNAIEELLVERPAWNDFYAGTVATVDKGRLDVYLTAEAPVEMTRAIAGVTEDLTASSILSAKYSLPELKLEAERLFDAGQAEAVSVCDGAGLVVEVADPTHAARLQSNPYVIRYETAEPVVPTTATRQHDCSTTPG